MMIFNKLCSASAAALLLFSCAENESLLKNVPVDFSEVEVCDDFWRPRMLLHADVTIPFCLDQCSVQTSRVRNFRIAAGMEEGEWKGLFYDDSDLYKMIEGAAYSLQNRSNPELEAQLDTIISAIAGAQLEDGYLNTYFTLARPEEKWTDMDKHEMYCCGHLIEAGIAYAHSTGKKRLLDVACRFADHIAARFGEGKEAWVPGHPEIELALVKLYRETGETKYLDLAYFLLEQRGRGKADWGEYTEYYVDEEPVADMTRICGHAVRCMYLFTGMADWSAQTGDGRYLPALDRLWDDVVYKKMYQTGGIGSSRQNEGFTEDYDLPNEEAYCETCASVGMVLWNQRMNMLKGEAKYTDVLERSMYNGALAGISLSNDRFFYVNPLASSGGHHRKPWYGTACCPSQISRFLPSVGGYIYAVSDEDLWINLFIGSSTEVQVAGTAVGVSQSTDYPWDGKVTVKLEPERPKRFGLKIRIPSWCNDWTLAVNGSSAAFRIEDGYAVIDRKWKPGDSVSFCMDMPVRVEAADPRVKADEGRRSVCRGPLVYCIEETDNPDFASAVLSADASFEVRREPELLGGVCTVTAVQDGGRLKFVPYYAWDNRDAGRMEVWVRYDERK